MHQSYTIHEIAELSGVSIRTLQYYDQIGLMSPGREENNYRFYTHEDVDRLQQILLYRHMGVKLKSIQGILDDEEFDALAALEDHLITLSAQQEELKLLVQNVQNTLAHMKGERMMTDSEKFEGMKKRMLEENEEKYGKEIREKYGEDTIAKSNEAFAGLTEEQWEHSQTLEKAFKAKLEEAIATNASPESELAQEACELHEQWLSLFWPKGHYSREAHVGLAEMYIADERFHTYLGLEASKYFLEAVSYRALLD